jgi:hypothetical protein
MAAYYHHFSRPTAATGQLSFMMYVRAQITYILLYSHKAKQAVIIFVNCTFWQTAT